MGKYNSLIRKAVRGLEKKNNAIYLVSRKEFYSNKHSRKMTIISLNKLINVIKKGKSVARTITIYSCVSEVDFLKRLAELLKDDDVKGGG